MIVIVDNGKGADEISRIVRSSKITKPNNIPSADAYILSDGIGVNSRDQKDLSALIKKTNRPVLAVGLGYVYLGAAFGASPKAASADKTEKVTIKQRSPILLDLKKTFSVICNQKYVLDSCPDGFGPVASSPRNELEIIQHGAIIGEVVDDPLPLFGVRFNPEAGLDGRKIIDNFVKFVEVWNKYHM
jgi:anthranilate/para-aminobenzoate synthase component II